MAINDIYFNAHALQRARGATVNRDGWTESNGGILNPVRVHVRPGQYLYRFSSSNESKASRSTGPWWIEYEVLTKIARFVQEQHATPRDAARYFLALPWSWTKVDRLVRARLVVKIDAYRGEGKPAACGQKYDSGTRIIPPQHVRELYQLYIPGMTNISTRVLADVSDTEIWSADAFTRW